MDNIELMINYACHFIGVRYKWGGSTPIDGFDCSGFVQECLSSIGKDPKGDQTAQAIYDTMKVYCKEDVVKRGSVLFFGKDKKSITHVALAFDEEHIVEAGGGGSKTHSPEDAIRDCAFVRIRPIRRDLIAFLNI